MKQRFLFTAVMLLVATSAMLSQGKFSGLMFGDYYYNVQRNATLPSAAASPAGGQDFSAFQLRRIYFTYDNDISENFTTRFRMEVDQSAGTTSSTVTTPTGTTTVNTGDELASGKVAPYVKDAYLTWKNVFSGSNVTFGVQPTPTFDVSETFWGYRSIEKTIGDLRGFAPSRDLGISLKGKITADGMFNYWVLIADGSGNNQETDMYKRYYAQLQIKPMANLLATIYADYKDAAPANASGSIGTWTEALFVGYAEPFSFNIGAELYMSAKSNSFTPPGGSVGSLNGMAYSIFGSYNFIPELALVLRYDNYDPNTDGSVTNDARNYVIAGLSWKVDKNVAIQPNVLYETYDAINGVTPDAAVTARVTVYYVFL